VTDFRDRYYRQLIAAGDAQLQGSAKRVPRWRLGRRGGVLALAVLLVSAGAVGASGSWRSLFGFQRTTSITSAPPPRSELAILGVLRRPQTPRDRSAPTQGALFYFGKSPSGIRPGYIRLLAVKAHGKGVALIPAVAYDPAFLKGTPELRARLAKSSPVCLFYPDVEGSGGGRTCWSQQDIERGRATASMGLHQYGLAPDGVTTVVADYGNGMSAKSEVRENFFDIDAPREPADAEVIPREPKALDWLNSSGERIARWQRP
jgi:hypothetical protein